MIELQPDPLGIALGFGLEMVVAVILALWGGYAVLDGCNGGTVSLFWVALRPKKRSNSCNYEG
jgi:hypothetical protein